MFVLSFGFASADTMIAGKIYNADYTATIDGANVVVSCTNGEVVNVQNTTSLSDGAYAVQFVESACDNGDDLTVYAEKGSLTGMQSGIVHDNVIGDWDLAVVNVPLVPEFGVVIGILTMISAVGIFFVVRRE
jgi:hypothetical protein